MANACHSWATDTFNLSGAKALHAVLSIKETALTRYCSDTGN